ncbi:hypothetical protein ACQSSU_20730 [Micromonospora echinospora]
MSKRNNRRRRRRRPTRKARLEATYRWRKAGGVMGWLLQALHALGSLYRILKDAGVL